MFQTAAILCALLLAATSLALVPDVASDTYDVAITGIHCKSCAREVTKLLMTIPHVRTVGVDPKEGTAVITTTDKALQQSDVEGALEGSKFKVKSFEKRKAAA